jgi:hypothetical protein
VNSNSGERASTRCRACGSEGDERGANTYERMGKNYQVVVACGSCRTSFVALSRN